MKCFPYYKEEFFLDIPNDELSEVIRGSSLRGEYLNGRLKIWNNSLVGNPFKPIAVCSHQRNRQSIIIEYRPNLGVILFSLLWFLNLLGGFTSALVAKAYLASFLIFAVMLFGYLLLNVCFWLGLYGLRKKLKPIFSM